MAGKTDPPSRLILSQTAAGNGLWGYVIAGTLSVRFLCSCRAAVPSSRPVLVSATPRTGAVKAGRRAWPASGAGVSRPCLVRSPVENCLGTSREGVAFENTTPLPITATIALEMIGMPGTSQRRMPGLDPPIL